MEKTEGNVNWNPDYLAKIARACHEANRIYCESIGDKSQKVWEEAEGWQRESAIRGVVFAIENPHLGSAEQHEVWMRDKIADGWVYGEVKNAEKKTHHCLVPYDKLPGIQKTKDKIFRETVFQYHDKIFGLSFGEAIVAAKQGKKVARAGWNGNGMFAYIVPAASYPAQTESAKKYFGDMVPYRAYWALKTAQNDVATWSPSGSDSLANDWLIIND